ncbi:MAG: hypothetical protein WCK67_02270 [bacterium]
MVLIKTGEKEYLTLAFGPPKDKSKDTEMVRFYSQSQGVKAVCGGTTAKIMARELDRDLEVLLGKDTGFPPKGRIDGIDIVTEGIIILSKTAEIIDKDMLCEIPLSKKIKTDEKYITYTSLNNKELLISEKACSNSIYVPQNPAEELACEMKSAKNIRFIVGQAENSAHQQFNLPIKTGNKIDIIKQLKTKLEKMGKKVEIIYF